MRPEPPAEPTETAEKTLDNHESGVAKRLRLTETYQDHYTITEVARLLGITRMAVKKYHRQHLPSIEVEGVHLFPGPQVRAYARTRRRTKAASRLAVSGIEVERLRRICEKYYRQNLDVAPSELLALAKRIAKL